MMKKQTLLFGVLLVAPLAFGPPALAGDPPIDGLDGEALHTSALVAPVLAGDRLEHADHALHVADFEAVALGGPTLAGNPGNPPPAVGWPMFAGGMGMMHGMVGMRGAMPMAPAAPRPGWGERHVGYPWGRPVISVVLEQREALGLTTEQVTKLEGLRSTFDGTASARLHEIGVRESDVHLALSSKPIDATRAEVAIRAISAGYADIEVARIRAITQAEAILTAEQREKFRTLTAGSHCPGTGQIS